MKVLAVCGSLQNRSANLELLRKAANLAPREVEILLFDGIRHLPHFNPDLDGDAPPAGVPEWRAQLQDCDAVLIASPEYGHSLAGALKNAIDWVIGSGELNGKPVAITAAVPSSERGRLGLAALRTTLEAVDAVVLGGNPIVRGPGLDAAIELLLSELVERAATANFASSAASQMP